MRKNLTGITSLLLILLLLFVAGSGAEAQTAKVRFIKGDHKIDVIVNSKLFTSFLFPENMEKPFLYPVIASNGSVITRGIPLQPRKGERTDHPHQVGVWFNNGNVNGLDFWNNSSAIPADKKDTYGHIAVKEIVKVKNGKKGSLNVISNWDDNKGNTILVENTRYIFSGDNTSRTIDHISTLTAANGTVTFTDNKEGMFAIRVDRAFEMPTDQPATFTDDKGNPTTVMVADNTGVTGMCTSGSGLKGDAVWGTTNDWVMLSGTK